MFLAKKWGILIKKESESLIFTGLKIPRDYQSILEEGREEGREEGTERGIKALILDNQEEGIPKSRIIEKLQRLFSLPQEKAEQYYKMFAEET